MVYAEMDPDIPYHALKQAILQRYEINPRASRMKLHQMRFHLGDDAAAYASRVSTLIKRWLIPPLHPDETDEEWLRAMEQQVLREVAMEQIQTGLPASLQARIDARGPVDVEELVQCIQEYQLEQKEEGQKRATPFRPKTEGGKVGLTAKDTSHSLTKGRKDFKHTSEKKEITCYRCKKPGHYARECPEEAFTMEETDTEDQSHKRVGMINGGPKTEMWIDTGCRRTTVRKDLIPQDALKPGHRTARVANGELLECELADVELEIGGRKYQVEAAVTERLPVPVLLGRDLPWKQLIVQEMTSEELKEWTSTDQGEEAFAVMTRAQTRKEKGAEEQQKLEESQAQGEASQLEIEPTSESAEDDGPEQDAETEEEPSFDFEEDLFGASQPTRPKLTKTQR